MSTPEAHQQTVFARLPLDSRDYEFDIEREMRLTVVDQIRGNEPRTVMGALLANPEGMAAASLAKAIDKSEGVVGWHVEKLAEEDLVVVISADGIMKARAFAAFTKDND